MTDGKWYKADASRILEIQTPMSMDVPDNMDPDAGMHYLLDSLDRALEPYSNSPINRGLLRQIKLEIANWMRQLETAGFDIDPSVHIFGRISPTDPERIDIAAVDGKYGLRPLQDQFGAIPGQWLHDALEKSYWALENLWDDLTVIYGRFNHDQIYRAQTNPLTEYLDHIIISGQPWGVILGKWATNGETDNE